jgi:DNA-binding CsgD family transcriptional regulator
MSENQTARLLRLTKAAGLTAKEVSSLCQMSIDMVYFYWKRIHIRRGKRIGRWIRKKDRAFIVELLLIGFDLFEIAKIFGYNPKDVTRFIQSTSKKGDWRWVHCLICASKFVTFHLAIRVCSKQSCMERWRMMRRPAAPQDG